MPPEPANRDGTISLEIVAHIAGLARLDLAPDTMSALCSDLDRVIDHVRTITAVDVDGVAPMAHPHDGTNRLDADVVGPTLDRAVLLAIAPAVEGPCIAVPKVLADGAGEG